MSAFEYTRDFCRVHLGLKRVSKAILIAIPTIAIGNWLLHFEVTSLGVDEKWAYRMNWPVITFLCFVLNRTVTFSDREKVSIRTWIVISLIHSCVSQTAYPLLVGAGVNYMWASAILLGVGPVFYLFHSVWTFRRGGITDNP